MSSAEEVKQVEEEAAMEQEMAEQPSNKRKAEEETEAEGAGGEGDAQPPAKALKTEGEEAAAGGEAGAAAKAASQEPVTIGYKHFATGKECFSYYHNLIAKLRKYQNLNDYEFHMVHELIKKGHPDAARKLEGGVRAIQIREVEIGSSVTACFFICHADNTDEDVSYRKCLANLFPEMKDLAAGNSSAQKNRGGRGGWGGSGRGGRSGGGGRGGRSGGGSRGGGRGGRGRGRR